MPNNDHIVRLKQEREQIEAQLRELQKEKERLARERKLEAERQTILSEIDQLKQSQGLLLQRMQGKQQIISRLELKKSGLETEIRTFQSEVQSFLQQNIRPIACMGAVGLALDESNQYSQDAKYIAASATVVCAGFLLFNEDFRNEVLFVVNQLNKADAHTKSLNEQINSIRSEIGIAKNELEKDETERREINIKISDYQSELESLASMTF